MTFSAKIDDRRKGPFTIGKVMPAEKQVVSLEACTELSQGGMAGQYTWAHFRAEGSLLGAQPLPY